LMPSTASASVRTRLSIISRVHHLQIRHIPA
jgi:hypothetical protein